MGNNESLSSAPKIPFGLNRHSSFKSGQNLTNHIFYVQFTKIWQIVNRFLEDSVGWYMITEGSADTVILKRTSPGRKPMPEKTERQAKAGVEI
jgi:hypothetical protein